MKIECIHCGAGGQIDETRIPPGVTSLNCPRCKKSFPIPTIGGINSQSPREPAPDVAPDFSPPLQPPPLSPTADPFPAPSPLPSVPASTPPQAVTAMLANCTVCSGKFPREEMVRFGAAWVCAACKPSYVQMLAQGTPRPGEMRYAGFWIRFGAKFLDGLILGAANILFTLMVGSLLSKPSPQAVLVSSLITFILSLGIAVGYNSYFLGKYRATLGKMACGLVVVTPEGQPISYGRGAGRYFAELLSGMIFGIGYLMVLFDDEKRALHDRICNTRVVYK